jgi:hypothetical protein
MIDNDIATPQPERAPTAEALLTSLLRSNAADLSAVDTRLREAREYVKREEDESSRLRTIRTGLQGALQAVRSVGASAPAP